MQKNYFTKLLKYMKNVYHIDHFIQKLSDGRKHPKYKTGQVILPLLIGFMLRIKSMNELELMLEENEFRNVGPIRTELPMIDTIRDTLKVIELDGLKHMLIHTVKNLLKIKFLIKVR